MLLSYAWNFCIFLRRIKTSNFIARASRNSRAQKTRNNTTISMEHISTLK
jgi:hypothetical protein